jgi:hypothetical protein
VWTTVGEQIKALSVEKIYRLAIEAFYDAAQKNKLTDNHREAPDTAIYFVESSVESLHRL